MNEKIYHWLDSFEMFHKKYIIMPLESLNSYSLEDSLFITVWSPPGFINQEIETRCYLNSNIQMSYFNVIFGQLILNIYCYTMMIGLEKESTFCSYLQKDHDYEGVTQTFWWDVFTERKNLLMYYLFWKI